MESEASFPRTIILFTLLLLMLCHPTEGSCRNLEIRTIIKHKALTNHTIHTIKPITDARTCRIQCFLESQCFGVNHCVDQDSTATCELTNSDHIRSKGDLVDKPGCTFYGSESGCSSNPCASNATCQGDFLQDPRPYRCICPKGYTGKMCEIDIDECALGNHGCHVNATCNNTIGGNSCTCKTGFHGNGTNCYDINECTSGVHGCSEHAKCTNSPGGHNCTCNNGFHGDGKVCIVCNGNDPLGMNDGSITNASITASSMFNRFHSPSRARLNITRVGYYKGAWSAKYKDVSQWLQIDLSSITVVKGIATQGRSNISQWVKSYSLQYSSTGSHFDDYEGGKIFIGNNDGNTTVKHDLLPYITARYIRVRPKTWYSHISMRMELYGCK